MKDTLRQGQDDVQLEAGKTTPNSIADLGMIFDRHTRQLINYRDLMSEADVCRWFNIRKGELRKAVARGEFPKATTLKAGNTPFWADSIIARVRRVDNEEEDYVGA